MRPIGRGTVLAAAFAGAVAFAQPAPEQQAVEVDAGAPSPAPKPAPGPPPAAVADAGAPAAPPRPKPTAAVEATKPADAGTVAAPPIQAAPAQAAPAQTSPIPPVLNDRARAFFTALIAGEPGPLVAQAELPFHLEERRIGSMEQLKAEWLNQLRSKRTDLLTFKGFEVLTPDEAEKRFGKPPARLSGWPIRSGKTYLVVANISGRAAVALYHAVGDDWRIVAYHD